MFIVDPASAKVLDVRPAPYNAFIGLMHDLHGRLLIPGREGRQVVGWLGVAMLLLGMSGIVIWWPKRGQWSTGFRIRQNARGYWLYRDLHGAAGIWGLVVFLIVSFSGVAIAFPDTVRGIVTLGMAQSVGRTNIRFAQRPHSRTNQGRKAARPRWRCRAGEGALSRCRYSKHRRSRQTQRRVARDVRQHGDGPVSTAYVDPWRKQIFAMRNVPGDTTDTFMAWQRPLHQGSGWGGLWRILVFLSGLLPSLFVTTGIVMWVKKRRARGRVRVLASARTEGANA